MYNNNRKPRRRKPNGAKQSQHGSNNQGNQHPSAGGKRRPRPQQGRGNKRPASSIDPARLIQEARTETVATFTSKLSIAELPINDKLKQRLLRKGYERPTEIQERTLDSLLAGRDLLGIAQTGTGKTGAFLIPIIEQLLHRSVKDYALVLVPTRELANQVEEEFKSMTKGLGLYSACFIGGTNINKDLQVLNRSSHVTIATPGRLLDLVQRKAFDLRKVHTLVLDEFDRMLDMGFVNDVKRIVRGMQKRQHTMLFSATLDKTQEHLIQDLLHDPVTVKVTSGQQSSERIDQDIVRVGEGEDKLNILTALIEAEGDAKILLFEETKHGVNKLAKRLNKAGIATQEIHGNKSQNARQTALKAFKDGRVNVLVATDVAARGIDVDNVALVINYQMPLTYDTYIHRIGRSGRAGKSGRALTFVTHQQMRAR
jgi:ATP-dependent RNA helicase RhlE